MPRALDPFRFLLIAVAGWMNQHQLLAIDYLREENRIFREQLAGQTSDQTPDFLRDRRPPAARSRSPARVQTKPAGCQPMTVSGFTITRRSVHRGQRRRSVVQNNRSKEFSGGRGRLRFSTATCWRKASTSS